MIPRLSVIIPVRNGIEFVKNAISSGQAIPLTPLEIVVVDDGSTDGTVEMLQDLAKDDPRLIVIQRPRDHGASAARNEGIAKARADIICFLDADDLLCAEPIARRVEWHEAHPETLLSFSNYETVLPNGSIEAHFTGYCPRFHKHLADRKGIIDLGASAFSLLFGENPVCTTGSMARRKELLALGGFSRELRQAEDWDLWIRLARRGSVAYSTNVEAFHTVRYGSLSTDVDDRTNHIANVVRRHRSFALRHCPTAALAASSAVEIARAEQSRLANRNNIAWAHYLAALVLFPNSSHARDFARSTAVLLGLRSGRIETFDERARLAETRAPQVTR